MRQRVDQQRIELFLQQLGWRFTKPGRVYLVGGTTMVYEGLRQQTLDIDLALEIADEDHSTFIATVRELRRIQRFNYPLARMESVTDNEKPPQRLDNYFLEYALKNVIH